MYNVTKLSTQQVEELKIQLDIVKGHEEKTVVLLGEVFPLTLQHVWGHENTDCINTLVSALSPTNKKSARVFFDSMQAHVWGPTKADKRIHAYGKRLNKGHTMETKGNMQRFFSLDDNGEVNPELGFFGGDYWAWEAYNIVVEAKEVNYFEMIGKAVDAAKAKGGLSEEEIMSYLIQDKGISTDNLLDLLAPAIAA